MSKRNRERRELNRLAKMGFTGVDYAALAEAIHRTVGSYTGTDGSGECLTYAIAGCAWLNRFTRIPHAVAGGHFIASVKGKEGDTLLEHKVHFEHFWIMRGAIGSWTYLDFSTRHNPALIRQGLENVRPEFEIHEIPVGIAMPFYVGDGEGLPWKYAVLSESSLHAQSEYTITDKAECAARVARYFR